MTEETGQVFNIRYSGLAALVWKVLVILESNNDVWNNTGNQERQKCHRLSKKPFKMTGYTSISRITDFSLIKPSLRKKVEAK